MKYFFPSWHLLAQSNNENTRAMLEICSKLTIKTPERRHRHCSGVFLVTFEQISHIALLFPLLALNKRMLTELIFNNERATKAC